MQKDKKDEIISALNKELARVNKQKNKYKKEVEMLSPVKESKEKIEQHSSLNLDLIFSVNVFNEVFLKKCELCVDVLQQKSLCADVLYFQIQRQLDKANKRISFSLSELYFALQIPKEFLN